MPARRIARSARAFVASSGRRGAIGADGLRRWRVGVAGAGALLLGVIGCGGTSAGDGPLSTEAPTGSLEVTVTTGGRDPDPDGYTLQVGAPPYAVVPPNGTVVVRDLTPGEHRISLGGVAANCAAADVVAPVKVEASRTARLALHVACTGPLRDVILVAVFDTVESGLSQRALVTMRSDGTVVEQITTDGSLYISPTLTADGRQIAFVGGSDAGLEGFYVMDADGANRRRVLARGDDDSNPSNPVISPDGRQIAFVRRQRSANGQREARVWVVNTDGTGLRKVSPDTAASFASDGVPAWSPDGRRIAFRRNFFTSARLYTIAVDGSDLRTIATGPYSPSNPAWSPDGRQLAFFDVPTGLIIVNVDGTGQRRLTAGGTDDSEPAWSPDGLQLVFTRAIDRRPQLVRINVDGTDETQLTRLKYGAVSPQWSRAAARPSVTP